MKKTFLSSIIILIFVFTFSYINCNIFYCSAEAVEYKVCVSNCAILLQPNSSLENNILEVKNYDQKIKINLTLIDDLSDNSNLKFYPVLNDENNIIGYILSSCVININESELNIKLQTNAKLNEQSEVFILKGEEYQNLKLNNEKIILDKNTNIKVLEKFNENITYTQISFYIGNEIFTGYVLTKNIRVSGFNYYLIIAIFILVIIGSTVIPIIVKNWKKKEKVN